MAFDVQGAKTAGYSDAEIADHLAGDAKFDANAARQAGYSDQEIIGHLTGVGPLQEKPAPPNAASDVGNSFMGGIGKGVAGIADLVTQASPVGQVDQILKGAAGLASAVQSGKRPQLVAPESAASDLAARYGYTPQTTGGRYAQSIGEMAPNALVPGGALARTAAVVVPGVTSEAAGETAQAMGGNALVQQAARAGGGLVGGVASSARLNPAAMAAMTGDEAAANALATRAGADPVAMRTQANALRDSGIAPTVLDVTGQRGLRLARAVGVTNDVAGETLQNNARTVTATTKPAVMARTRGLSSEGRTSNQLAADLDAARSTEARTTYEAPYAAPVDLTNLDVIQALRDPEGASAINRAITAARARMDYKAVADLEALKVTANGPTGNGQVWPTTGRALDRVQIAFRDKGNALAQNGANDIASGMFKRRDLINSALDNVEGLQPARAAYRAKSQAIDILQTPGVRRDPFSTDPADYRAWVDSLSPEAQHANQVAIRQEILDTLGGQRSSTVGSIDELATSPYARENLGHALGAEEASGYLGNLAARLTQRGNAQFVSPNAGSRTAVLENDTGNALRRAVDVADVAHKVTTGNVVGLAAKAAAWLKTRGMSDQQAQALAQASVDPARLDGVIGAIERAQGPGSGRQFLTFRAGLLGAATGAGSRATSPALP